MKRLFLLFSLCCLLFLVSSSVLNAQVRINEFLIDPLQKVELINSGSSTVDVTGWFIDDSGGSTFFTIPQTILPPNSCSVFESDFNLNKSSADTIRLFDNTSLPTSLSAKLIDSFSYKASSGSGISFKRIPDGGGLWSTGSADLGFFNNAINSCVAQPVASPTPTPAVVSPTLSPVATTIIENIFISEIMANPISGEKEWVELYNDNDFVVELNRWFIDDIEEGGSSPKSITAKVPARAYTVIEFGTSLFNNGGDTVRLVDFNEEERDKFEYLYSEKGKSWGRISFDTKIFCLQEPTHGFQNGPCITTNKTVAKINKKVNATIVNSKTPSSKPTPRNQVYLKTIKTKNSVPKTNATVSDGEILGESSTMQEVEKPKSPRVLSVISLSYSLLTIISIFFKMKLALS